MKIVFFGSSLTSAYWNGAATYYRGICRALHRMGHQVTFVEQDIYDRQEHRDLAEDPDYAQVVICRNLADLERELSRATAADLVIKCSGVGRYDEHLEKAVLEARTPLNRVAFWDVDAPCTLDKTYSDPGGCFRELVPRYDAILTYGGGPRVVEGYRRLGARLVELVYNAFDPDIHHPVAPDPSVACDLLFVGNRLPDREARVDDFFFDVATMCPEHRFLLGGEGWGDHPMPPNVRYLGHVPTNEHNRLNCSARLVLNINRASMAEYGFSPPTRVFEAAGAGACLVTDRWDGIEEFLSPGEEVLVGATPREVASRVCLVGPDAAGAIGRRAMARMLRDHTYEVRGRQIETFLALLFGD